MGLKKESEKSKSVNVLFTLEAVDIVPIMQGLSITAKMIKNMV